MAKKKTVVTASALSAFWPAHELPFVREIQAHPFDDAPRLVFADWLEERGDARAEFIRLQCEFAQLRASDPQYPALAAREQALIEKHRADWLRRMPAPQRGTWGIDGAWWWFDESLGRHHFTRGFCAALHTRSVGMFLDQADLQIEELQTTIRTNREIKRLTNDPRLSR